MFQIDWNAWYERLRSLLPFYCEDIHAHDTFPVEPWNTWTNLFIIAIGIAAVRMVWQRQPQSNGPIILAWMIVVTGVASFLWHGLRIPILFVLDAFPGQICLCILLWYWLRVFNSKSLTTLGLVSVCAAQGSAMMLTGHTSWRVLAVLIGVVLGVAVAIGVQTISTSRRAAALSAAMIVCAFTALLCRTLDASGYSCQYIEIGTHFLWHILLSSAGYIGILMLMELEEATKRT